MWDGNHTWTKQPDIKNCRLPKQIHSERELWSLVIGMSSRSTAQRNNNDIRYSPWVNETPSLPPSPPKCSCIVVFNSIISTDEKKHNYIHKATAITKRTIPLILLQSSSHTRQASIVIYLSIHSSTWCVLCTCMRLYIHPYITCGAFCRYSRPIKNKSTTLDKVCNIFYHRSRRHPMKYSTYQMQDGVDHLPVGHLAHLDESDEQAELEVVRHRHADHLLRPLDLSVGGPGWRRSY